MGSRQSPTKVGVDGHRVEFRVFVQSYRFHSPFSGQRFARALKEGKARDLKPDEPFRIPAGRNWPLGLCLRREKAAQGC